MCGESLFQAALELVDEFIVVLDASTALVKFVNKPLRKHLGWVEDSSLLQDICKDHSKIRVGDDHSLSGTLALASQSGQGILLTT